MVDQINTQLNVDLDLSKPIKQAASLSSELEAIIRAVADLSKIPDLLSANFTELGSQLKVINTQIKAFQQGTVESALGRAGLTAQRAEFKGSELGVALAAARDELTLQKQLAATGRELVRQYEIQQQIKRGIANLDTLRLQEEQTLARITQISLGSEANKKKLLGEQAVILRDIRAGIQSMEALEANRLKYEKEKTAELKKQQREQEKLAQAAAKEAASKKQSGFRTQDEYLEARRKGLISASGSSISSTNDVVSGLQKRSLADLLVVQTKLLFNYQLIGAALNSITGAVTQVRELDRAFHQLQAIGAITNTQMTALKQNILEVARNSRFTAVEVGEASIVLAQAGLSADQIKDSIQAVVQLATAAGTDLKNAVDVVTSVLNVFDFQAAQTGQIANLLTSALNESKLSMDQLVLAIQYASNIARDAGVPFTELTASISVLADAGIRSGSTIGTGYRQLLNDLQSPSERLKTRLNELGLSMEDVSLKSKGLAGVIRTLKDAGFTTADALNTLEVRAASTFSALARGVDNIELTEQKLQLSQAAVAANEIQMASLDSAIKRLQSSLGGLAYSISNDLVTAVTAAANGISDLVNSLGPFKEVLRIIADLIAVVAGLRFLKWIASIVGLLSVLKPLISTLGLLVRGIGAVVGWIASFAAGMATVGRAILVFTGLGGLLITALTAIGYGLYKLIGGLSDTSSEMDKLKAKVDESEQALDKYQQQNKQLTSFIENLRNKQEYLRGNTDALRATILEAKNAFDSLGGSVITLSDNYDTLLGKVIALKQQNYQQIAAAAGAVQVNLLNLNRQGQTEVETQAQSLRGLQGVDNLPAELRKVVQDAVAIGARGTTDVNQYGDVQGAFKRLNAISGQFTKDDDKALVEQILQNLNKQTSLISQINQNNINLTLASRTEAAAKFDRFATLASEPLIGVLRNLSADGKERLKSITTSKGLQDLETEYDTAIENTRKGIAFIGKLIDVPALSNEAGEVEKQIAELRNQRDAVKANRLKLINFETANFEEEVKIRIERYKTQSKVISRREAEELQAKFDADRKALAEVRIRRAKAEIQDPNFLANAGVPGLVDDPEKGITARSDFLKQEEARRVQKEMADFSADSLAFATTLSERLGKYSEAVNDKLLPTAEELKNAFEDLTTATKNAIAVAELPVKVKQAQIDALDVGNNRFNVTDAQRYFAGKELEGLQAKSSIQVLEALQKQATLLPAQIEAQKAEKARLESLAASRGFTAKDLAGASEGRRNDREFQRLAAQYKSIVNTLQASNAEMDELTVKLAEAEAKARAFNDALEAQPIDDVFFDSLRKYTDETTKMSRSNAQLGRDFEKLFGDITSGFGGVVKGIVTGNKKMGESFRDLASQVVESMLDIAVNRTASSLFDTLFSTGAGSLLSWITGAPSVAPESSYAPGQITSTNLPPLRSALGGIVRGGVPNRDSVGAMLMPGEGVLTKKAVDMLGEDTVNALNASAGRAVSQSQNVGSPNQQGGNPGQADVINFYLVDDRSAIGAMGPKDVIAVVGDDISRGGSLKRLIRSVVV